MSKELSMVTAANSSDTMLAMFVALGKKIANFFNFFKEVRWIVCGA